MTTRSRTRGALADPTHTYFQARYRNCSDTAWVTLLDYPAFKLGKVETMNDEVIPDFVKRQKAGEIFFNPMSRTEKLLTSSPGHGHEFRSTTFPCGSTRSEWKGTTGDFLGGILRAHYFPGNPSELVAESLLSDSAMESARTEASTAVWANRGQSGTNYLETYAEIKTAGLRLKPKITELNKRMNTAERLVHQTGDLSGAWLHMRYGIMPTVRDIAAYLSAMGHKKSTVRRTTRGYANLHDSTQRTIYIQHGDARTQCTEYITDRYKCRAMSLDEYQSTLLTELGLTAKNLLVLPVELATLSFVGNWFVNIYDAIKAIVPEPDVKMLGSALVTERTRTREITAVATTTTNPSLWLVQGSVSGAVQGSWKDIARTNISSPGLVVRADFGLDNPMRALDALSLVAQRFVRVFGGDIIKASRYSKVYTE